MAPTNSGVSINTSGALSGSAWGENTGWINFDGSAINCSGQFTGTASGDTVGTVTFTCTTNANCNVITDYRPQSCRGGGGGGPGPITPPIPTYCGDDTCNGFEGCGNCPEDCGSCQEPVCGNNECEFSESCETCPDDCGECILEPLCGNKICEGEETCKNCPGDCGICLPICGDNKCEGDENCKTCPNDCGICLPICGDNKCEAPESCEICPSDCGECKKEPFCGDGFCKDDESCKNCPDDCGYCQPAPSCGDKTCEGEESCKNCPDDCGECKIIQPYSYCGDKDCKGEENCENCPTDCEECKKIIPIIPPIIPFSPIDITTKTITTVSLITVVLATAFASPLSLPEILLIPTRLMGILLMAFGWKKRNPPWGVVYDSITKQPLDPAYVILKDSTGKDVSSAITDLDGRYGFLIEPGFYKIIANKTNYIFPSQKLVGKTKDELYDNLYFGDQVEIKRDEVVTRNIPLDSIKFDWNEYTKQNKSLTKFFTRWDLFLRKISDFMYFVGFIIAIIAFFLAPYPYNSIILGLYVFLLVLRILGIKPRPYGSVIDIENGTPIAFSILRIMDPSSNREISHKITDKYGRYFCLIPKGKYYVKIEKKNDDGSYSLVHTSPVIDASKNGIIKDKFRIFIKDTNTTTPPPTTPPKNTGNNLYN
jgi:hypothetical protein